MGLFHRSLFTYQVNVLAAKGLNLLHNATFGQRMTLDFDVTYARCMQ
jgi:hypothetical protein